MNENRDNKPEPTNQKQKNRPTNLKQTTRTKQQNRSHLTGPTNQDQQTKSQKKQTNKTAQKKTKNSCKRPSAQRHAHTFTAVMLLHINWDAAHEIVHPAATLEVFRCGYVIGQFKDGIIVHLKVHHLAVFTTK